MTELATDPVHRPAHYVGAGGLEVIDIIEGYGLANSFHLGNAMKYLLRAPKKGNALQDLEKALWYLNRWMNYGGEEVTPESDTLLERPMDFVCDGFGITGSHREAVEAIIAFCIYELPDDGDHPIQDAIDHVERAIGELPTT